MLPANLLSPLLRSINRVRRSLKLVILLDLCAKNVGHMIMESNKCVPTGGLHLAPPLGESAQ